MRRQLFKSYNEEFKQQVVKECIETSHYGLMLIKSGKEDKAFIILQKVLDFL